MKEKRTKFIKEPIFLFFAIGILLYVIYIFSTAQFDRKNRTITVSDSQLALLTETFKKTWNREPSEKEIESQIENFIKDEVFYKEAVAMGLDKSDVAVKRRLRQLMELMMDDAATVYPSEDQLKIYLNKHPEKFQKDPIISFEQKYFAQSKKKEAETQLNNLTNNIPLDQSKIGNLALIPSRFENESKFSIDRRLGKEFSDELFQLETGKWVGPIESAYGWHLIFINHFQAGKMPELSEVWDEVEREWALEQKNIKKEQQYEQMKSNYKIVFEKDE